MDTQNIQQNIQKKVLITTTNQEKVKAVNTALSQYLQINEDHIFIEALASDSGIFHGQPWSMQHTYEGAISRIHNLKKTLEIQKKNLKDYDYIISVENGVITINTHQQVFAQDIACVVVEDLKQSHQQFSFSVSRNYPLKQVHTLTEQGTDGYGIGSFIKEFYNKKDLEFSRFDQIVMATKMALSSSQIKDETIYKNIEILQK